MSFIKTWVNVQNYQNPELQKFKTLRLKLKIKERCLAFMLCIPMDLSPKIRDLRLLNLETMIVLFLKKCINQV